MSTKINPPTAEMRDKALAEADQAFAREKPLRQYRSVAEIEAEALAVLRNAGKEDRK